MEIYTNSPPPLKVTFSNSVPDKLIFCSNPSHFQQIVNWVNVWTLETLARHSEAQFLTTVRIKKSKKYENISRYENSSSKIFVTCLRPFYYCTGVQKLTNVTLKRLDVSRNFRWKNVFGTLIPCPLQLQTVP